MFVGDEAEMAIEMKADDRAERRWSPPGPGVVLRPRGKVGIGAR
jgi:hypothetical protein